MKLSEPDRESVKRGNILWYLRERKSAVEYDRGLISWGWVADFTGKRNGFSIRPKGAVLVEENLPMLTASICERDGGDRKMRLGKYAFVSRYNLADCQIAWEWILVVSAAEEDSQVIGSGGVLEEDAVQRSVSDGAVESLQDIRACRRPQSDQAVAIWVAWVGGDENWKCGLVRKMGTAACVAARLTKCLLRDLVVCKLQFC
jgi:hypothetical protein